MKKYALLLCLIALTGCSGVEGGSGSGSNSNSDSSYTSDGSNSNSSGSDSSIPGEDDDPEEEIDIAIKDGPILHAWDWSISMVRSALDDIEKAGYKNIQLSPLHPSKDTSASAYWWNLYQPQGFKVATGNENPLGTKEQLMQLTQEAAERDINIIMDVVTNHLGGPSENSLDQKVSQFEPEIFNQNLIHHNGRVQNWNDRYQIVTYAIGGYPDLQTENHTVQNSVIRMVKEYIDCGVKGFRFDAAKHIETPNENGYGSDFWPNVTNAIYTYGEEKFGEKPFVYGEILDDAHTDIANYTKYISVTDNRQGSDVTFGVRDRNVYNAAKTASYVGGGEHAVLWAESHDTFENSNGTTTGLSTDVLNLAYAIQISRKDSTALFFARPSQNYPVDKAPQVISGAKGDYKCALVSAANKFHNDFVGGSESITISNSAVVNVRKTDKNEGALIADVNCDDSTVTVNVGGLSDGEYINIIDNEKYTVSGNKVTVKLTKGGCVLEKEAGKGQGKPSVSIVSEDIAFTDTTYVNIVTNNATSSTYRINYGGSISFSDSIRIPVTGSNGEINISVTASNNKGSTTKDISVYKTPLASNNFVIVNVPNDVALAVWSWNSSHDGSWETLTKDGKVWSTNLTKNNYLISKFNVGDPIDWDHSRGQTADFTRTNKVVLDYKEVII